LEFRRWWSRRAEAERQGKHSAVGRLEEKESSEAVWVAVEAEEREEQAVVVEGAALAKQRRQRQLCRTHTTMVPEQL